jgi:hypothetical protein
VGVACGQEVSNRTSAGGGDARFSRRAGAMAFGACLRDIAIVNERRATQNPYLGPPLREEIHWGGGRAHAPNQAPSAGVPPATERLHVLTPTDGRRGAGTTQEAICGSRVWSQSLRRKWHAARR